MNVIIINGQGGVGKDALIKEVKKAGYKVMNVSSIDPVKKLARKAGWDGEKDQKGRKFLADLKAAMTEYDDLPRKYCEGKIYEALTQDVDYLFIHIREPNNIGYMKRAAKIILSDCNKRFDVATLLVRRDSLRYFGNVSDDEVENYVYDIEFDNNKPLKKSGDEFVKALSDYFERKETKLGGQTQTERGLLMIEAAYQSEERAQMDGYSFAFHSTKLGKDLYSKCLDDRGLRHTFAVIEGYN